MAFPRARVWDAKDRVREWCLEWWDECWLEAEECTTAVEGRGMLNAAPGETGTMLSRPE